MNVKFTVLANTFKKLWFCSLMVFAIGWSSVSIASVKAMHTNMQIQNEKITQKDCIDLEKQITEHKHDYQMQNMQDCHQQLIKTTQAQHTDCQECTILSCQSSIVWFDLELPQYSVPEQFKNTDTENFTYKIHSPAGYWQKFLRPPKV